MRKAIVALTLLCVAAACTSRQHADCAQQGHELGTRAYDACQDAGGNPLATGDGSPLNHEERLD